VASVRRFTVRARRIGGWWALDVEGEPGVHSQVRRIDQAEEMARDAIAGVLDIAPDSFEIVVAPEVPAAVRTMVDQAMKARSHAAQAQVAAAQLTRDAAQRLVAGGLTVRDAGVLLGVSHQRVAQLTRPTPQLRSASMGARIDLEDKEAVRRAVDE
jgi:predicted RNase H-like HicB family nuclease